jgi:hypothetical protein
MLDSICIRYTEALHVFNRNVISRLLFYAVFHLRSLPDINSVSEAACISAFVLVGYEEVGILLRCR